MKVCLKTADLYHTDNSDAKQNDGTDATRTDFNNRVSTMGMSNADASIAHFIIFFVVNNSRVHKASHLALFLVQFFIIVIHGRLGLFVERGGMPIEKITEPRNALTAEDTENLTLLGRKLRWSLAAECSEVFSQECLNTRKAEVSKSRAVVE